MKQTGADPEITLTACDLIFNFRETSTKLTGALTYKTQIFDHDHITHMKTCFEQNLRYMITREKLTPWDVPQGHNWPNLFDDQSS